MDIAWHNTLKHIKITKTWQNTKNINKLKITGHPIECEFAVHKPLKPYTAKNRLGSLKAETVKKRMDERHFEALFFNQPQLENEITAKPR